METGAQCSGVLAHRCVIPHHVDSVAETLNGQSLLWYWRRPNSKALDVPSPEGLVPEERADNARFPGQQSGGSRAASTMVHHCVNLREEPTMWCGFDKPDGF
jgi:hypothetical protein